MLASDWYVAGITSRAYIPLTLPIIVNTLCETLYPDVPLPDSGLGLFRFPLVHSSRLEGNGDKSLTTRSKWQQ